MDQIQSQDISSVKMDLCQMLLIQEERQEFDVNRVKQPRKEISIVQRKHLQNLNQLQFSLLVQSRGQLGMVPSVQELDH